MESTINWQIGENWQRTCVPVGWQLHVGVIEALVNDARAVEAAWDVPLIPG